MKHRRARLRFFDAVSKSAMKTFEKEKNPSHILVFDGVDCRGAERPIGTPREPEMYSSDDNVERLLARKPCDPPIGEGDLKLTNISSQIQSFRNSSSAFTTIEVMFICTIDTDSLAIELLHRAKMELSYASNTQDRPLKTILCFRETSRKRAAGDTQRTSPTFSCFDMEMLNNSVTKELFNEVERTPTPNDNLHAVALLCAGWALCGCDFVRLSGMRTDFVISAVKNICSTDAKLLKNMAHICTLNNNSSVEEKTRANTQLAESIGALVDNCITLLSGVPRMKRAYTATSLYELNHIQRSAWCVLYWSGIEFVDIERWGFGGTPSGVRHTVS